MQSSSWGWDVARDPEASEPFTDRELEVVFEAAEADPSEWAVQAAKFLAYTGAHICVLSGGFRQETQKDGSIERWYQPAIRSDAIRGDRIHWARPKTERHVGIELSKYIREWVAEWLELPRPLSRRRYGQVLARVGKQVHLQVNPLRFRHTCAVKLKQLGLTDREIQKRLGVSYHVMVLYINDPRWVTAEKMRLGDW